MSNYYKRQISRSRDRFRLNRDYDSPLDAARDNGYKTPDEVNRFRNANRQTYRYLRGAYMNRPRREERDEPRREVEQKGPAPWKPEPRERPLSTYKFNAPIPGVPFTESPSAEDFTNRNQLPIDYYRYFYGDVSRRQVEMRNAERRANTLRGLQAAKAQEEQTEYQEQLAAAERRQEIAAARGSDARRFQTGQYGARFDEGPENRTFLEGQYGDRYNAERYRPAEFAYGDRLANEALVALDRQRATQELAEGGERRFLEGQYGDRFRFGEEPAALPEEVSEGPRSILGGDTPYTPQWVEPWLDARDQSQPLTDEEIYMLELVGYLEPTDYAASSGYSGGGGYGGYGYGGRGGGGGYSYTPSSYNPRRQGAGQARGGNSLGLVSWRI